MLSVRTLSTTYCKTPKRKTKNDTKKGVQTEKMATKQKKARHLGYQAQRASNGKPLEVVGFPQGEEYVPSIRVAGKWLREFGFDFGSKTILTATEGQIVITTKGGDVDETGEHYAQSH